ncbi:MAG: hypothetical protein ACREQC_12315 [Candidatus Binataceae bacterium]
MEAVARHGGRTARGFSAAMRLEEQMRVRDLAELIAEATGAATK